MVPGLRGANEKDFLVVVWVEVKGKGRRGARVQLQATGGRDAGDALLSYRPHLPYNMHHE